MHGASVVFYDDSSVTPASVQLRIRLAPSVTDVASGLTWSAGVQGQGSSAWGSSVIDPDLPAIEGGPSGCGGPQVPNPDHRWACDRGRPLRGAAGHRHPTGPRHPIDNTKTPICLRSRAAPSGGGGPQETNPDPDPRSACALGRPPGSPAAAHVAGGGPRTPTPDPTEWDPRIWELGIRPGTSSKIGARSGARLRYRSG